MVPSASFTKRALLSRTGLFVSASIIMFPASSRLFLHLIKADTPGKVCSSSCCLLLEELSRETVCNFTKFGILTIMEEQASKSLTRGGTQSLEYTTLFAVFVVFIMGGPNNSSSEPPNKSSILFTQMSQYLIGKDKKNI